MRFNRTIIDSVINSISEYPVTLITGARQVGKTTLVSYFERNMNYLYVSFDDEEILKFAKDNPREFLNKYPYPLIIDEVQKAQNIFVEIEKKVNDVRRKEGSEKANGMYILTGSQKYNLMKEVSESMSGRVSIINMQPLSQAEIRNWVEKPFDTNLEKIDEKINNRMLSEDMLYESIVRGFYPARWEIENKPITNFYSNYVKTYLERDVSQLINLKDKNKFESFLTILASLTGQELIVDNISKTLGVSNSTINEWLSIVSTGDIITLLQPYYEDSINKRIVKRNKLYFNDTGLACYLLGIDSKKTLQLSSFKGRMIETYIHNEIRKSFINNNIEPNMYFYRDNNQNEIDFIILKDGNINFVEAKAGKEYGSDAIKGFSKLNKTKYEINGKVVICSTNDLYRIESGVYAIPIKGI